MSFTSGCMSIVMACAIARSNSRRCYSRSPERRPGSRPRKPQGGVGWRGGVAQSVRGAELIPRKSEVRVLPPLPDVSGRRVPSRLQGRADLPHDAVGAALVERLLRRERGQPFGDLARRDQGACRRPLDVRVGADDGGIDLQDDVAVLGCQPGPDAFRVVAWNAGCSAGAQTAGGRIRARQRFGQRSFGRIAKRGSAWRLQCLNQARWIAAQLNESMRLNGSRSTRLRTIPRFHLL